MNLVIVESPSKGKTINKYLGSNYKVLASYGHIVDLPSKNGSVLPEENFLMKYEANIKSEKHIKEICDAAKKSDNIYLATDPDREGEAIAWHVAEVIKERKSLKKGSSIKRIAFNEITKKSVESAIQNPRDLDQDLIDAQQARRALDYLVGFTLSPLLWRKVPGCKSAGRVQSVALRLISERETEIEKFKQQEYWTIFAGLLNSGSEKISAKLVAVENKKLDKFDIPNNEQAQKLEEIIKISSFEVLNIEKKKQKRNPYAPFTTSTLQQEAARKLGFSAKKTMQVAQKLYEGVDIGKETVALITYMRTDGVSIAKEALEEIRDYIKSEYGEKYLPPKERVYQAKAKNAQEAHEAIRPIDVTQIPSKLKNKISEDLYDLYELIWKRAVSCQMESAVLDTVSVQIGTNKNMEFRTTGSIIAFDGFYKVYREGIDDKTKEDEEESENKILPPLKIGEKLSLTEVLPKQHFTEPPPRYSEASLVKKLEELGIGRPSTYASIISVLQDRDYVVLEKKRFIPHSKGRVLTAFLENYFKKYVEYDFTAELENELDEVASGSKKWKTLLGDFWKGFDSNIKDVSEFKMSDILIKLEEILSEQLFKENQSRKCVSCESGKLNLKFGKYGVFISCSNYPECNYTKQISGDDNQENADNPDSPSSGGSAANQVIGSIGDKSIYLKKGPYGWYLQLGNPTSTDKKDVKRAPIPANVKLDDVNEDLAKKLLSLPINIGKFGDEDILGSIGKFGPYVKVGKVIASIPRGKDLFSISVDEAVELIKKKMNKEK